MATLSSSIGLTYSLVQQQLAGAGHFAFRASTGRVNAAAQPPAVFGTSPFNLQAAALTSALDDSSRTEKTLQADKVASLLKSARAIAQQALDTSATLAKVTGSVADLQPKTRIEIAADSVITVSDGHTTASYAHRAGNDVQDFIDAVNDTADLNIEASLTSDGRLQLEATDTNAVAIGGTVDAEATLGLTVGTTTSKTESARQQLARRLDAVLDEIDAVGLELDGTRVTATGLGITPSGRGGELQSDAEVAAVVRGLDHAATTFAERSAPLRSEEAIRRAAGFSRAADDLLRPGEAGLSFAARDEAAQGLAARARAQLVGSSLGIATHAGTNALRLFA